MSLPAERVQGIGGLFFRAKDRESLCAWYRDHLGIDVDTAWWGAVMPWAAQDRAESAATVWSAFAHDTSYFGAEKNTFMVNFRVRDLTAMLAQLRAAGCDVDDKEERSEYGAFGWVTDPEGSRIELWEPPATPPA